MLVLSVHGRCGGVVQQCVFESSSWFHGLNRQDHDTRPPHSSSNLPDAWSKSNPLQLDQVWVSTPILEKSSSIWVDTNTAHSAEAIDK